jgi:hypothetical protein
MANLKTFENIYWSFRKFLYTSFPLIPAYYNPTMRPATTATTFMVVRFQDDSFGKLAVSYPRVFCVAKADPEEIIVGALVSGLVEKLTSPGNVLKTIPLINHATGLSIGFAWLKDVRARMTLPYSEGYVQRAVDMTLRYTVEERHLNSGG